MCVLMVVVSKELKLVKPIVPFSDVALVQSDVSVIATSWGIIGSLVVLPLALC